LKIRVHENLIIITTTSFEQDWKSYQSGW